MNSGRPAAVGPGAAEPVGCPCLPSRVSLFSQASLQHVFIDFRCSPDFLFHICCFLMIIISTHTPSYWELLGPSSTRWCPAGEQRLTMPHGDAPYTPMAVWLLGLRAVKAEVEFFEDRTRRLWRKGCHQYTAVWWLQPTTTCTNCSQCCESFQLPNPIVTFQSVPVWTSLMHWKVNHSPQLLFCF